ncbi:APOBEC1 complementation factor-like [Diabrotica virgifera virgifera]|uniref:RRM domain-containing protein n=1 Tax=Diabrotica virgifera virgifera TaxID=50390 RepID=A0ABM5IKP1_DIAVI|nr:APOBEC1 complementation factor-like [Diabrotica virgifera virgifera]
MVVYDNMDFKDPPTLLLLTDNLEIRHLTGYTCDMSSACRRVVYHPLKNCGYTPESNSEIYVQGLPSDTTDSELMKFFQQCGNIFKLKVMLINGNTNRGFCFVTFMNSEVAKSSLYLNCVPFRPDCFLRISISYNNRRIFLGNIPLSKSRDDVWKELVKNGVTNITDVIMYRGYADRAQNRGFVFVEFEGHEQAAGFRARFENQLFLWDKKIIIDWSVPLPIVDDSKIDQATTIFMRNLPVTFGREELQQLLYKLMRKENIQRVYKFKNYAFVHLFERSQAEELMKILQGNDIKLQITLWLP